jgi:hypothetical protein
MVAPEAALGKAMEVVGELGLWQKVLAKLIGEPDQAAQHLAVALAEVRKTLGSLRETIMEISYLGVPGQDPVDVRRALDRIELGQLYEEVIRAKGSCRKIGNIYDRHLKAWFPRLLKPHEADGIARLFNDLRNSDGWAIDALERILQEAKPLATEIRTLLASGDQPMARKRITAFTHEMRPAIEKLSAVIAFMLQVEAEFVRQQRLT